MKTLKIAGILVVLSLIMTAFMPVVTAHSIERDYAEIAQNMEIKQTSDDGTVSTYIATYKISDTETRYYLNFATFG